MIYHISESREAISCRKFLRDIYECGIRNGNLIEIIFEINVILITDDHATLENPEKIKKKGYGRFNNSSRKNLLNITFD